MVWTKLDDRVLTHRKLAALSDCAFAAWVRALIWCGAELTDGAIPRPVVRMFAEDAARAAVELVDAGLWHDMGDHYQVHDYLDHQPSRAEVESRRDQRQSAGKRGGAAKRGAKRGAKQLAKQDAKQLAKQVGQQTPGAVPATEHDDADRQPSLVVIDPRMYQRQSTEKRVVVGDAKRGAKRDARQTPGEMAAPDPGSRIPDPEPRIHDTTRSSSLGDVRRVFESWKLDTGHHRAKLDQRRESRIRSRLREGFTPEQLIEAITHRHHNPWLMGENPDGKIYDGISTLLRDAEQVETLLALDRPPARASPTNRTDQRVSELLRRAAQEEPDDDENRSDEAMRLPAGGLPARPSG